MRWCERWIRLILHGVRLVIVAEDWCVSKMHWSWASNQLSNWGNVVGWGRFVDDGIETIVVIGGVVDSSDRTIRLDQGVLAFHDITVAFFGLRFDVTGVWVLDAVVE